MLGGKDTHTPVVPTINEIVDCQAANLTYWIFLKLSSVFSCEKKMFSFAHTFWNFMKTTAQLKALSVNLCGCQ